MINHSIHIPPFGVDAAFKLFYHKNMNEISLEKLQNDFKDHKLERLKARKARDAAILIPLVEDEDGEVSVLFEVRSRRIIQGGEICFPGGRVEKGEKPEDTVIRETAEELSIPEDSIKLIAPMFAMNGISDSFIFSYLGSIADYKHTYSEDEVGSVFTLSIKELLKTEPKHSQAEFVFNKPDDFHYELVPGGIDYHWAKRIKDYYFYETEHGIIWGMTGEMLHSFIEKVRLHENGS